MSKQQTPNIRFQGFSGDWEEKTLGDIFEISSASRVLKEQWQKEGVPFFRTSDVVAAFKGENNEKAFISFELFEDLSKKSGRPQKGDLLVTGGGSIGIPFLISNDNPIYFKDADLLWFKSAEKTDGNFLFYSLFGKKFKEYLKSISHTGTISHYTIVQAKCTPITLPSETEQTQIGQFFQTLDRLIAQSKATLSKSQQLKKAMLAKMFPMAGETVPQIRFKGFTGAWERKKLGEIADIVRGASPRPIQDPKWFDDSSDIGWLRISDVTAQNGRIHYLEQKISKAGQENTRVLEEPHLLLSIAASVGKPVINYVKTGVHDGFLIFRSPDFELEFMFQYLDSFVESWQCYGQPGTQVNLNSDIVKNADFFIPPTPEEQTAIGNFFRQLDDTITLQQAELAKLTQLKKALLAVMLV
ncbi:hypothetical protein A1D25_06865 [Ursidibacter arcticus]|uniref:restriction endonuclease subunit S n=1 Tax=Ursidibacter arcticus TaxID=1524965 RepID=UPI0012FB284D|nr:restriction endonuclease subunit S [Ursidibacter arcticus]KAE9534231.1 hypothetical protein A1D25_06865 [Ursidibacter arcticus]